MRRNPFIFQVARVLGGLAFLVALTGCTAGSVSSLVLAAVLALGSAGLSACASSHSNVDGSARIDGGQDAGGVWESCCVDGAITTCFCPAGAICNYGWFERCGDGTCGMNDCDAGAPNTEDAGMSTWEPCCSGGMITLCECPAGFACNYGWFERCSESTCVSPGEQCPSDLDAGIDAGSIEPDGTWEPCCVEERVTTCLCPAGAVCNFGWFTPCSDGSCVAAPGGSC